MEKYLLIAVGGALGSMARYWVGVTVTDRLGARFPFGTFVINLTACVIIGFALTFLSRRAEWNVALRYLIPVGFVGAYSTFSTFEWETYAHLRAGELLHAVGYVVASLVLGLLAVWAGAALAEMVG